MQHGSLSSHFVLPSFYLNILHLIANLECVGMATLRGLCRITACFVVVVMLTGISLAQNVTFTRGQKFQIVLLGIPDVSKAPLQPVDATVWDIDLFDSPSSTIRALKQSGKTVLCYFSAGTGEDWRDDYKDFPAADLGKILPEWPNEKWIRISSQTIRNIMAKRIKLASDKGCDAIDPDNTGKFQLSMRSHECSTDHYYRRLRT